MPLSVIFWIGQGNVLNFIALFFRAQLAENVYRYAGGFEVRPFIFIAVVLETCDAFGLAYRYVGSLSFQEVGVGLEIRRIRYHEPIVSAVVNGTACGSISGHTYSTINCCERH